MICATLVNTHTHTDTQTAFNYLSQVKLKIKTDWRYHEMDLAKDEAVRIIEDRQKATIKYVLLIANPPGWQQ